MAVNPVLIDVKAKNSAGPVLNQLNNQLKRTEHQGKAVDKQFRMIRGGMGQMGHQIQDVAVMLQSGQNPMIILGQQGSQVASLFGPQGAIIGAFLAVGAAIGTSMLPALFKTSEALKQVKERTKSLIDEFDKLTPVLKDIALRNAAVLMQDYEKQIEKATKKQEAYRNGVKMVNAQALGLTERIEEVNEKIQEQQDIIDVAKEGMQTLAKQVDGTTDATESLIESLTSEANALGLTQAEQVRLTDAYKNASPANQKIIDDQLKKIKNYDDLIARMEAEQAAFKKAEKEKEAFEKRRQKRYETIRKENQKRNKEADEQAEKDVLREENLFIAIQKLNDKKIADEKRVQNEITSLKLASIDMASNTVGQLADIAKEGSKEAKVLFAMQKALAIAQILVSTEQAAIAAGAQGAALGGVMGFLTSASTIRAMGYASAGIVAGQALASFEGGGLTGSGARSGGMDGKGGMLAMVHPNEKITDLHKGQGDSKVVNVNFSIQANDTAGFDRLLNSRRGQIVNMINQAVNDRGRPSIA